MAGKPEDLNNFNLGLPDFEVPSAPVEPVVSPVVPIPNTVSNDATSDVVAATAVTPVGAGASNAAQQSQRKNNETEVVSETVTLEADAVNDGLVSAQPISSEKKQTKKVAPVATAKAETVPAAAAKKPMVQLGRGVPSWMISMLFHVAVILVLGTMSFEPVKQELKMMLVSGENLGDSESDGLEEFAFEEASASELQASDTQESPMDNMPSMDAVTVDASSSLSYTDVVAPGVGSVGIPSMTQSLVPKGGIASQSGSAMKAAMNGRSKEAKRDLLKKFGGSTETEIAVSRSLKWLAAHQNPETGAWNFAHSLFCNGQCDKFGNRRSSQNAATGLALMCFLGAGQTHMEGEYKETVFKGLSYLLDSIKVHKGYGEWYNKVGDINEDMYSHGIATIAICEAYGMTKDARLAAPAQLGINFLAVAQNNSTGGWHYDPSGTGDTSIVGWQMMALKSGAMSNLTIDIDVVRKGNAFLDAMMAGDGNSYTYDFNSKSANAGYNPATTACAFLCRMYSGMPKDNPHLVEAVKRFSADGPNFGDIYYNYYATQVIKQVGGPEWESWNVRMRDHLLTTQVKSGHATGSWYWEDKIGSNEGGRLYLTCMATMILEVYYRYMPLYAEQAEEDAFKL